MSKVEGIQSTDLQSQHSCLSEPDEYCSSSILQFEESDPEPKLESIEVQGLDNCGQKTQSEEIPGTIKIFQHQIGNKVYTVHKVEF